MFLHQDVLITNLSPHSRKSTTAYSGILCSFSTWYASQRFRWKYWIKWNMNVNRRWMLQLHNIRALTGMCQQVCSTLHTAQPCLRAWIFSVFFLLCKSHAFHADVRFLESFVLLFRIFLSDSICTESLPNYYLRSALLILALWTVIYSMWILIFLCDFILLALVCALSSCSMRTVCDRVVRVYITPLLDSLRV